MTGRICILSPKSSLKVAAAGFLHSWGIGVAFKREGDGAGGYSHNKHSVLRQGSACYRSIKRVKVFFFFFKDVFVHPLDNYMTIIYYQKTILLCLSGADLVGAW